MRNPNFPLLVGRLCAGWMSICLVGCSDPDFQDLAPHAGHSADNIIHQHNTAAAAMGCADYARAHSIFEQLVKEHPTRLDAQVNLAIAKMSRHRMGDPEAAAALLDRVIEQDPDRIRAIYCRALVHLDSSQLRPALRRFQQVTQADPGDAYAFYFAGRCLLDLGQVKEALDQFRRAQDLDPYLCSAHYGAFQTLQLLENTNKSLEALRQFLRQREDPQARYADVAYPRMGPKAMVVAVNGRGV